MLSSLMMFGQKALSSKDNMSNIFTCIAEQPLIPLIGENHFEVSSVFQYIPDLSIPKGITMLTDKEKLKAASDRFLLKAKINEYRKMYRNNLNLINQVVRGGKIKQTDVFEIISCDCIMVKILFFRPGLSIKNYNFSFLILAFILMNLS